ncbi:hypothetical protein AYI68_g8259 [Smittium mucronatum]|uniref:Uncharacterized protein n=1 Tax=Smittium mucronatum TaxID=133383 RepID=A0A1R0GLF9_9FUNG|nr:hypothetical protein AYI68_g8259 [Smittium mucronatum]
MLVVFVGLALENVPFDGFDGPKFWRTLNQCWIFSLEHAAAATAAATGAGAPKSPENSAAVVVSVATTVTADLEAGPGSASRDPNRPFSPDYIVDLQQEIVGWSESLACYGLVDYEMGFWETDIMDTLESIRKSIA